MDWWHARTSFPDMVDIPSDAFRPYIPDFAFAFFNIRGMDEETVRENIILRFYVEIVKYQNDPRIKEIPSRLTRGLSEVLDSNTAIDYIRVFFKYLTKASEHLHREDYRKALSILPEGGKDIMETLADQWIREGKEIGFKEGTERGIKEGTERGIKEGKERGIKEGTERGIVIGELRATQNMLLELASAKYGGLPLSLEKDILSIQSLIILKNLTRQLLNLGAIEDFTALVKKTIEA